MPTVEFVPPDFLPADFVVPTELVAVDFRLTPLLPEHNDPDYEAWTSSIEHIRATPGYPDGRWPRPMPKEENLRDLERHAADFRERRGFTYTVQDLHGATIGCVYVYPSDRDGFDADVRSWVRASHAHLDVPLYDVVSSWLRSEWPFTTVDYASREQTSD